MDKTPVASVRRFLHSKAAANGIPISGIFELTPRCNLNCKMCYIRLTQEQMAPIGREYTAEEWIDMGKQCAKNGMCFLLLTGGEPTLRADFPKIYEELVKLGLSISINTNATMLSESIKELWHRLPPAQVNITLYGTCREDYKNLCDNELAFDAVVKNIDWLIEEGILVQLNATITDTNLHKWMEYQEFAQSRGVELRTTSYCFPPTRRYAIANCKEFSRLNPTLAGKLIADEIFFREGIEGIKNRISDMSVPFHKNCDCEDGEPMRCYAGRSQFWLTWYGNMTLCGMIDKPFTKPFSDGFSVAWAQLKKICSDIHLYKGCKDCPEQNSCMNCAAVTFAETGEFNGKPEYMCELNNAYRKRLSDIVLENDHT